MSQPWSNIGDLSPPMPTKVEEPALPVKTDAEKKALENAVEKFLRRVQETETLQHLTPTSQSLVTAIHEDISTVLSSLFILSKDPTTSNPKLVSNPRMSLLFQDILTKFNTWAPNVPVEEVANIGLVLSKLVWKDFDTSGLSEAWTRVWIKNLVQIYWAVAESFGWNC